MSPCFRELCGPDVIWGFVSCGPLASGEAGQLYPGVQMSVWHSDFSGQRHHGPPCPCHRASPAAQARTEQTDVTCSDAQVTAYWL